MIMINTSVTVFAAEKDSTEPWERPAEVHLENLDRTKYSETELAALDEAVSAAKNAQGGSDKELTEAYWKLSSVLDDMVVTVIAFDDNPSPTKSKAPVSIWLIAGGAVIVCAAAAAVLIAAKKKKK